MPLPESLRARNPAAAARVAALVLGASAAVVAGAAVLDPVNRTTAGQVDCWVLVVLLALACWLCRRISPHTLDARGGLLAVPVLGAVAVNVSNYVTADYSAAAQIFLIAPVLVGSAKFRAPAAALTTAIAVIGDAWVTFSLAEPARAGTDVFFAGAALTLTTVVLVGSENRREELVRQLEQLAHVDAVTGLASRRVLEDATAHALQEGSGAALVLIDVDHFKTVNDEHGHPVGDAALTHLAAVLLGAVRRTDAVLARLGGDELAAVLPGCSSGDAAARAEELLLAVRATPLPLPDGTLLALSVSIGVAQLPTGDVRELYAAADEALYRAKRAGRDQLAVAGG